MQREVLFEMREITKRFPGVVANDRVSFSVMAGEIHALLGENGAGKSTLMSILAGLYRPDEGEIYIKGQRVQFKSPKDAFNSGVGMIHQHFKLVQPFTVAENIILGCNSTPFVLRRRKAEGKIRRFSEEYGMKVEPEARIWQLSVGEQQRVEILKVLYRGADILILDEPTTVLTPQEVRELFEIMRKMAAHGCAVVIITHKLQEVMEIADRITVLRKGKSVGTVEKDKTSEKELTEMMMGQEMVLRRRRTWNIKGETVLRLEGVSALNDKGLPALQGVSLSIRQGEILGIAGVAGNGQKELTEVICGLRPVTGGQIFLSDEAITSLPVKEIIDRGVRYVPEDRLGMGLVPNLDITENMLLKDYRRRKFSAGPWLSRKKAREEAAKAVEQFAVKTPNLSTPVRMLSGGNLQKLLFAREVSGDAKLLIASYPVRGLDIGATENVYNLLLEQREKGRAVLFISEDLDAIFSLSDRVAVLCDGQVMGIIPGGKVDLEEVGLMMAGAKRVEAV